jgi:tetratricopeptide (TPR) repeat protein
LEDFGKAIELAPTDVYGHVARAHCFRHLGKHAEALADLNKAAEISPSFPQIYTQRANLLVHLGRLAEARADYEQIVQQYAAYASVVTLTYANALASVLRGQYEVGFKQVEAMLGENPDNTQWLYDMACVYALSARVVALDGGNSSREEHSRLYRTRALDLLEKAVRTGYRNFLHLKADFDLDSLKREPRFLALVEK